MKTNFSPRKWLRFLHLLVFGAVATGVQAQLNCSSTPYVSQTPPTYTTKTCSDQSVFGNHAYTNADQDFTTTGELSLPKNSAQISVTNDGNLLAQAGECVLIDEDFEVSALNNGSFCAFTEEAIFNTIEVEDWIPNGAGIYHIPEMKKLELSIGLDSRFQDDIDQFIDSYDARPSSGTPNPYTYYVYNHQSPAPGLNPYDPEQVDLQAIFISPTGKRHEVYGFYYQEISRYSDVNGQPQGWLEQATDRPWRIRFTPDEAGQWSYFLALRVNEEPVQGYLSKCRTFECDTDNNAKGYVQVAGNKRYFEFSKTNELFMPLASSVDTAFRLNQQSCPTNCVEANDGRFSYQMGIDYNYHDFMVERIDALSANGGNTIRAIPRIEWEHLGVYHNRQFRMKEFDDVIEYGTSKGIYFQLAGIFSHTATWNKKDGNRYAPFTWYEDQGPILHSWIGETINIPICPSWSPGPIDLINYYGSPMFGNPYNRELLLQSTSNYNPYAMMDPGPNGSHYHEVKKLARRLVRYYAARWGYCSNIFLVTPSSEADQFFNDDNDQASNQAARSLNYCNWRNWHLEMVEYYKSMCPNQLVSSNIAGTPNDYVGGSYHDFYSNPLNEVVVENIYTGQADRLHKFNHYLRKHSASPTVYGHGFDKPALFGEFGVNYNEFTNTDKRALNDSLIFHNQIWAAAMSGTAGGMDFWGNTSYQKNCYQQFLSLSAFLAGLGSNGMNNWANPRPVVTKNDGTGWYGSTSASLWESDVPASHTIGKNSTNGQENHLECFGVKDNADIIVAWVHNMYSHYRNFAQAEIDGADCYVPKADVAQLDGLNPKIPDPNGYTAYGAIKGVELTFPSLQQNGNYKVELWDSYGSGMIYTMTMVADGAGNLKVGGNFIPDLGADTRLQQEDPATRKPCDYALVIRKIPNKKAAAKPTMFRDLAIQTYPNPFSDQVTFELDVPQSGVGSLSLFNINGVQIAQVYEGELLAGKQSLVYDSEDLPSGIFFYEFKMGENVVRGKIEHIR